MQSYNPAIPGYTFYQWYHKLSPLLIISIHYIPFISKRQSQNDELFVKLVHTTQCSIRSYRWNGTKLWNSLHVSTDVKGIKPFSRFRQNSTILWLTIIMQLLIPEILMIILSYILLFSLWTNALICKTAILSVYSFRSYSCFRSPALLDLWTI